MKRIATTVRPSAVEAHLAESDDNILSPRDLRQWLQTEVRDVMKEAELRVKDATDLVTAYATGEITPAEAMERVGRYTARWGEAMRGAQIQEGMTDKTILQTVDEYRLHPPKDWKKFFSERGGKQR